MSEKVKMYVFVEWGDHRDGTLERRTMFFWGAEDKYGRSTAATKRMAQSFAHGTAEAAGQQPLRWGWGPLTCYRAYLYGEKIPKKGAA